MEQVVEPMGGRAEVVVIGVGSEFRRDDGVGCAVVRRLDGRLGEGAALELSDGDPGRLIALWEGAGLAVVVDAAHAHPGRPGRVHRLETAGGADGSGSAGRGQGAGAGAGAGRDVRADLRDRPGTAGGAGADEPGAGGAGIGGAGADGTGAGGTGAAAPAGRSGQASSHGLGLGEAVELARALDRLPERLVVYAVEGRDTSCGTGLSEPVAEAVGPLADRIAAEVAGYLARTGGG
ncbi:hydrogenase maturation protease [Streptacidiphilus sp. ASG 303]|uniref:hydrogenase maturation protease n=1 Tax=Streptacidiphilus sp. ASG 303 TaxID=2896847 RepID=UPI0035AE4F93